MQIFPESLREVWNKWELRVLVLLSLFLQITLIALGSRRKSKTENWSRLILWLAYLSADSVATISLGVLSNTKGDSKDDSHGVLPSSSTHGDGDSKNNPLDPGYVMMALWAPFLLVHLGGPDNITAYSLEDNELWLRHLLGLVLQVGVALYVFLRSLVPTGLNFVALPVFVAGIVKYGERTWVLRSASSKHFRESLLPSPDPGPNYHKLMDEYMLKEKEGFRLSWEAPKVGAAEVEAPNNAAGGSSQNPEEILNTAYEFFLTFKCLFADLILSFQDLEKSKSFFQANYHDDKASTSSDIASNASNAFKVIEIELGFIYDVLYTKATIIYSMWGGLLRCVSLFSTIVALIAFSFIDWHGYSWVDVIITLLLQGGAIELEIYAIAKLLSSDWTLFWLSKHKILSANSKLYERAIERKRWSNSMAQQNLLSSCFKDKPRMCGKTLSCAWIHNIIEDYLEKTSEHVSDAIKTSMFKQLLEKSEEALKPEKCKEICGHRGDRVLEKTSCEDDLGCSAQVEFGWSTQVEFDHSILLWHLATDLCYYSDLCQKIECEVSKLLSNYMLYLLVKRPFMLPNGIGQIRFQDTLAEARQFAQEKKITKENGTSVDKFRSFSDKLLRVENKIDVAKVKGDRSKSVLFEACKLAKSLQNVGIDKKWKMISEVWVEMLSYAASRCSSKEHAQQLRRGGELLTHVWLLMAHLGVTEQFQISEGHGRTRLIED